MKAEIVAVGTELLLGQIANENARWISVRLADIGFDVAYHQVVGDNFDRIVDVLDQAARRADAVIVTGGLGPTEDDITRDALARVIGAEMEFHPEIEKLLRSKFEGYGRGPMPENNLRQAFVPVGARYITPDRGTAPGLIADVPGGGRVYSVPGVPAEMVEMMEGTIFPELVEMAGVSVLRSKTLRCTGIGESRVAEILKDLFDASSNPSVAYLASTGEVKVRLTAKALTEDEADAMVAPLADEIARRLGDVVFTRDDEDLEEAVGRLLKACGKTLSCAESLTGGGIAERLTNFDGASSYFMGSAVVYTAEAKHSVLGVSSATLDSPGPVSETCAREMAAGARRIYGTDIAVAVTGVAGPAGHGGEEPGTVWLALDAGEVTHARKFDFPGQRDRVRRWTEQAAMDLVRRYLEGRPLPVGDKVI